jgi:hypothetical protein
LNRALLNLLKRGLIAKTDGLPLKQGAEKFDPRAVKRFLQQDPLDPVTATPLELLAEWVVTVPAGAPQESEELESLSSLDLPVTRQMAKVDFYLLLKQVAPDVSRVKPGPMTEVRLHTGQSRDAGDQPGISAGRRRREAHSKRVQFRYWLFFVGVNIFLLWLIVKSSR